MASAIPRSARALLSGHAGVAAVEGNARQEACARLSADGMGLNERNEKAQMQRLSSLQSHGGVSAPWLRSQLVRRAST